MGRRPYRSRIPSARTLRRAGLVRLRKSNPKLNRPRSQSASRKALLLGTALASTLLLGTLTAPTPASAQATCFPGDAGVAPVPGPIAIINPGDSIECFNVYDRNDGGTGIVIDLETAGVGQPIDLFNSGRLTANDAGGAVGIFTYTTGSGSFITIENTGDMTVTGGARAYGIQALTNENQSPINIVNSGDLTATAGTIAAYGIYAETNDDFSAIDIVNSGRIDATGTGALADAYGIFARTTDGTSSINILNTGPIHATGADNGIGIFALTYDPTSPINITNGGDIWATGSNFAIAIDAQMLADATGTLTIANSGDLTATSTAGVATGIYSLTVQPNSPTVITNSGDISATGDVAFGIRASTTDPNSAITITETAAITAIGTFYAYGISAETTDDSSRISIMNASHITAISGGYAFGIYTYTAGFDSRISINNVGDIAVTATDSAFGIFAQTNGDESPIDIINTGDITVTGCCAVGIFADTFGYDSRIHIENSASVRASGPNGFGITAYTFAADSPVEIVNSGEVSGSYAGIGVQAYSVNINNSGSITADSLFAIRALANEVEIVNSGTITGFVGLLALNSTFHNQPGGIFEARQYSNFGGYGVFNNQSGAIVHTAADPNVAEVTIFVGLEHFNNEGLVSLVDGQVGDVFQLTNCGCGVVTFTGSGNSTLAIDAFLGAPGTSMADNFIVDGNVTGQTALLINNTNPGGGVFNPQGIPVVFINGNVNSDAFFLPQPFDSGLFDWDVYFVPTGSGFFELRSFPGGGAHVLPQLLTATQDIWHSTNETWFDRTADLRVLLNGGAAYGASGDKPGGTGFTPGVWMKGSGTWLEQDGHAQTSAYGQTYRYNLNRDLNLWNIEGGVDFGKKGVWAEGDALIFGVLGGAVFASLDYDQVIRRFNIEGGEVGVYATYLRGGLFVDNLFKADFLEFDTNGAPGMPGSLDATSWGFRTDAGYRFGQFRRGPFVEPLATIAVVWSEIDDFALGGNAVKFDDETDVRGRLGLRVGTSREVWPAIVMEPFVIGSVWGHLSGENEATVTSLGTTFGPFTDEPDDVWGEVSTGVNFFSPGANSSLFAKLDVTFGDEIEGVSARGGARFNW